MNKLKEARKLVDESILTEADYRLLAEKERDNVEYCTYAEHIHNLFCDIINDLHIKGWKK